MISAILNAKIGRPLIHQTKQKQFKSKEYENVIEKVILRGIGAAVAHKLAEAGAKVIINYAGGKRQPTKPLMLL